MGIIDRIKDFDEQPLSQISYTMIKWFNFDTVDISMKYRANVESRVWICIEIVKGDKAWYVDGQSIGIVKIRLINFLKDQIK